MHHKEICLHQCQNQQHLLLFNQCNDQKIEAFDASKLLENALSLRHFFEPHASLLYSLGIKKIYLFGSVVTGTMKSTSDIDVALLVYCGNNLALLNIHLDSVVAEIKKQLEIACYKVEVDGVPRPGDIHLRGVMLDGANNPMDFITYERTLTLWSVEI